MQVQDGCALCELSNSRHWHQQKDVIEKLDYRCYCLICIALMVPLEASISWRALSAPSDNFHGGNSRLIFITP